MEFNSVLVLVSCLVTVGSAQDYPSSCWYTHTEKAYTGPYEIDYPRDGRSQLRSPSCWLIKAYRTGYVVHLKFHDVNVTQNEHTNICTEQIVVHDGKGVSDTVLESFCGIREPEIITTQRQALIVFNTNSTYGSKARFKVKYRAIKRRAVNVDSFALSIAFGGTIGAIALLVICSGVLRRYKQSQRGRTSFFLFRRPRVNNDTSNGRGDESASGRNGHNRVGQAAGNIEHASFKHRLLKFIQDILNMKSGGNVEETGTPAPDSDESSRHRRRGRDRNTNRLSGPQRGHINSSLSNRYPEFSSTSCSDATDSSASHIGHEAFGYRDIPVSSFTSDPDAVRPPTYEDSVNRANPLYLYQYGNVAQYNRAFDMKDENNYIYSPPPPYTEINHNIVEEQPTSQLRASAQEVTNGPVESARLEEASTLERSSDTGNTVASSPEEDKNIDEEIDPCQKDSDTEKIVEYFEKNDTGLEEHNDNGGSHGVRITEGTSCIKSPETLALIEESEDSSKPLDSTSDRDGELKVDGILVKDTPKGSGTQSTSTNKGEKCSRQTVTIPLDMMRRSGLKTSKSVSPKHMGVTPVEECGAVGYSAAHQDSTCTNMTDGRLMTNVGASDQGEEATDLIEKNNVDHPKGDEHDTNSQNGNEVKTGVVIIKSGEIEL